MPNYYQNSSSCMNIYLYHISLYKDMKILVLHVCICVVSTHSFSLP